MTSPTRGLPEGSEVARLLADADREKTSARAPYFALAVCELRRGPDGGYYRDIWSLRVISTTTGAVVHVIALPEWDDIRPASAGHRLIEHGYMTMPATHYAPDAAAGWRRITDNLYHAVVISRDGDAGPGGCAVKCAYNAAQKGAGSGSE